VAPEPISGEAMNPQVGPTLRRPVRLSIFCLAVEAIAFIATSLVVQRPKKTFTQKRAAHSSPLGGAGAGDAEALTINIKMSTTRPLGGADGDPGAPTINVKNIDGGPPGKC
jgi:hypothetical protein